MFKTFANLHWLCRSIIVSRSIVGLSHLCLIFFPVRDISYGELECAHLYQNYQLTLSGKQNISDLIVRWYAWWSLHLLCILYLSPAFRSFFARRIFICESCASMFNAPFVCLAGSTFSMRSRTIVSPNISSSACGKWR